MSSVIEHQKDQERFLKLYDIMKYHWRCRGWDLLEDGSGMVWGRVFPLVKWPRIQRQGTYMGGLRI